MLNLFTKPTLILILVLSIGLGVLLLIRIFLGSKEPSSPPPPVIYQQASDKPSSTFTTIETSYPEAPPQQYRSEDKGTGSLVITSEPEGARILVDSSEEEVPIDGVVNPINTTPFKVSSIPAGEHYVFAGKPGYNFTETSFSIEEGQLTRVHIQLTPEGDKVGY